MQALKSGASALAVAAMMTFAPAALAQNARSANGTTEHRAEDDNAIVVTARKRDETDISVPVSITAMSKSQIDRQAIINAYDIAQRIPTLTINTTGSGVGGGVFLRGIGTAATTTNSLDQSVAFDFDGVPTSRGNLLRIGNYDLAQVEVLKGPQALFFGKNSPAGVISFKSKDPTPRFELVAKGTWEPYANLRAVEGSVSGPIGSSLGYRFFGRVAKSDGEKRNLVALALPANAIVPNAVTVPSNKHAWGYDDTFFRGTIVYDPVQNFKVRLKLSRDAQNGDGVGSLKEKFYCPRGTAQNGTAAALLGGGANAAALAAALSVDDCRANGTIYAGNINPALLTAPNLPSKDPSSITSSRIWIASGQIDYSPVDWLSFTSVSGLIDVKELNYDNFSYGPPSVAALGFFTDFGYRQFSQEVRAVSNIRGPVNFSVGGFYQDATLHTYTSNFATPPYNIFNYRIPNKVYSVFGQLRAAVTDQLEVAAGVRYTHETKRLTLTRDGVVQPTANPNATFNNASPEATITYRPTSRLTLYSAYKTGFKSGGYAATISGNAAPLPTTGTLADFLFNSEDAKGFEAGTKGLLFDNQLRFDVTGYMYKYGNLQVSNVNTSTGTPVLRVFNAATAKQQGVEIDLTYSPRSVRGLRLHTLLNFNDSYYTDFTSPCYIGQSIAEGCNVNPTAAGVFTAQSLKGRQFTDSSRFVMSSGFSYEFTMNGARVEFGADTVHKSSYNATSDLSPGGVQRASTTLNAQVRLIAERGWELGVIGKNLTNVYRALENSNAPLTGISANTGTAAGGINSRADLTGNTTPGRAVFLQLTLHLSDWLR